MKQPAMVPSHDSEVIPIFSLRNDRVILDQDVARLFGVQTKRLNEQVNRNEERFGEFAFRLTTEEFNDLRSQIATSGANWGGVRYPPRVFTEHGVVMAATVLKSERAVDASRQIVRTFVEARRQAWERALATQGRGALAIDPAVRQGLLVKLNSTLSHVLDAIVDPTEGKSIRDEAREIAAEGLRSLKEYLKRAGISNEKTLAEVRRLMAEAESIEVETAKKRTENQHRQLALLAKKLKLVIQAQLFAETGSIEGLMAVLTDLEK